MNLFKNKLFYLFQKNEESGTRVLRFRVDMPIRLHPPVIQLRVAIARGSVERRYPFGGAKLTFLKFSRCQ